MPSPISHAAIGYLIYKQALKSCRLKSDRKVFGIPVLMISAILLSLLPDLDSVVGILMHDFGRFHNNFSHSLVIGLPAAMLLGFVLSRGQGRGYFFWFFLVLAGYELHVIMDVFTYGRGVKALWPFSGERLISPAILFYGFRWSDGLFSFNHFITISTETVFAVLLIGVFDREGRELILKYTRRMAESIGLS